MSRAFVNEDAGGQDPPRTFGLPPVDDPSYEAASALTLLEAARDGYVHQAEEATGFRWGEPQLRDHVRALIAKEQARPEAERDRRFIRMGKRYLSAG